jgi:signal transduction histidine kinase
VLALAGTPEAVFEGAPASLTDPAATFGARWITLLILAGAAVICLPRQFQVTVVENTSESQIRTASWLFPLYLLLITLFVVPIALAGLRLLPAGSDPDLYVLTLPLSAHQDMLGLFVFLGGFSSATSMVIVSSIALSTMISNHVVVPLALRFALIPTTGARDVRSFILGARRASIVFIVALGFLYFWLSGTSDALAAIGLISFCGLAQFLPALVGGLCWRRATHRGAFAGLVAGFVIWAYALFLPSFGGFFLMPASVIADGPFGWTWLRPYALFGLTRLDPLVHAFFWSMFANVLLFVAVSLTREPTPLARFQSALFVDVFRRQTESELRVIRRIARVADLRRIAERILGPVEAIQIFGLAAAERQPVLASDALISQVERRLAANVGAASARSLVSRVVTSETIGVDELKRLAGEAEQIRAYSAELEAKSSQIEATVADLARANEQLRAIDSQKDDFLSQVSHELRTPMASIRSFSDILLSSRDLPERRRLRFLGIIQKESLRLTRLLDGILHLNQLETGGPSWAVSLFDPEAALDYALESCEALAEQSGVALKRGPRARFARIEGDGDKLAQVFINLISNAIRHNASPRPEVVVTSRVVRGTYEVAVTDGVGVPEADRERIFEKFTRGGAGQTGGAGLGLAISRQIVERFKGELALQPSRSGARFTVRVTVATRTTAGSRGR